MSERIPQRIDYYRYTDRRVFLKGVIKQQVLKDNLPRLCDAIAETAADVEYQLQFDVDVLSNRIVTGVVKTMVILQCQRCMKDYVQSLSGDISMAFVENNFESERAEESHYDTFLVNMENINRDSSDSHQTRKSSAGKGLIDPRILIEDELLLMLPQIPRHSETGPGTLCHIQFSYPVNPFGEQGIDSSGQDNGQVDNNPFAVLKQLKK